MQTNPPAPASSESPIRILSLIPSATETVVALGHRDSLVGVTHSCDYPADLRCAVVTSTSIPRDAESSRIDDVVKTSLQTGEPLYVLDTTTVEALEPDVILTQSVCEVCAVGEAQTLVGLDGLGISPRVVSLHPHRFADVLDDLDRVGQAIGATSAASTLLSEYQLRIHRVEKAVEDASPVRVGVLEWTDPPFSSGHWTPDLVQLAGGQEVLAIGGDRSKELRWEEVLAEDPDTLVLACCGLDVERTRADLTKLRRNAVFRRLEAVRSGRVYLADGGSHFSRPGPRLIEALELLAATLHPERFPDHKRLVAARL